MAKKSLTTFIATACHYAQNHLSDAEIGMGDREFCLEPTSFMVSCFLSKNTVDGRNGVESEIVLEALCHDKSISEWKKIIDKHAKNFGGWKKTVA